jgi:hypothetical protein
VCEGSSRKNAYTADLYWNGNKMNYPAGSSGYGTGRTLYIDEDQKVKIDIVYPKGSLSTWTRWRSSDSSVARVSATTGGAYITGKKAGTALISARTPDGRDMRMTIEVNGFVDASDGYTELNKFRTKKNNWYWNSDNKTKTYVNTNASNTLKPLDRDIMLEYSAMVRAAELIDSFSHTRPDGTPFYEAYYEQLDFMGENILYGYHMSMTAKEAVDLFAEENEKYSGQGHRRMMLDTRPNSVGIACLKYNGYIYWAQEFGYVEEDAYWRTAKRGGSSSVFAVPDLKGDAVIANDKSAKSAGSGTGEGVSEWVSEK